MDLFDHPTSSSANNDDGDNTGAEAQDAASQANNLRPHEMIDFFAAEKERMRPPSPDRRDAGLELFPLDTASLSPPAAAPVIDDDQEEKEEMAAVRAEWQRIEEENRRLRYMIAQMCAQTQHSRFTIPSASTPPTDALVDVPESSAAAAMTGRGEVPWAGGCGLRKRSRNEKEVALDAASENREESSENDYDQHQYRNSNKKLNSSPSPPEKDDEAGAAMKKSRVVVRIRTETGDLSGIVKIDGCQWRKYGQKNPKESPTTPRSYYRCSMATNCPMRKHLQKCAGDESAVDVTYQGAHSHQLPRAAVPMVRAIAAALEMVTSGSMPHGEALMDTSALAETMPAGSRAPRMATVSTLSPFPSALLDLSKSPDLAQFQGQPPAAPGAAPGEPARLIQMSVHMLAAAFSDFSRGSGGNGGAH